MSLTTARPEQNPPNRKKEKRRRSHAGDNEEPTVPVKTPRWSSNMWFFSHELPRAPIPHSNSSRQRRTCTSSRKHPRSTPPGRLREKKKCCRRREKKKLCIVCEVRPGKRRPLTGRCRFQVHTHRRPEGGAAPVTESPVTELLFIGRWQNDNTEACCAFDYLHGGAAAQHRDQRWANYFTGVSRWVQDLTEGPKQEKIMNKIYRKYVR